MSYQIDVQTVALQLLGKYAATPTQSPARLSGVAKGSFRLTSL